VVSHTGLSWAPDAVHPVPADARHGTLAMAWGTFRWTAPIEVR